MELKTTHDSIIDAVYVAINPPVSNWEVETGN
jgi:hypothetical protein